MSAYAIDVETNELLGPGTFDYETGTFVLGNLTFSVNDITRDPDGVVTLPDGRRLIMLQKTYPPEAGLVFSLDELWNRAVELLPSRSQCALANMSAAERLRICDRAMDALAHSGQYWEMSLRAVKREIQHYLTLRGYYARKR